MPDSPVRYTPYGPAADAAVDALIQSAWNGLRDKKLLPVSAIAHYLVGDYVRAEGWAAMEGEAWLPYETPRLLLLLPEEFGQEAHDAQRLIDSALEDLCMAAGYSLSITAVARDQLAESRHRRLAFDLATSRRLVWSYDRHDPLEGFVAPTAAQLAEVARAEFVAMEPLWRELSELSATDMFALHPGIVRLTFIRAIEAISGLGDAVLMQVDRFRAPLESRLLGLLELAEEGRVRPEFAALYGAAIALRIRQPRPVLPPWEALKTLVTEIHAWSRYVAHSQFGAEIAHPAA
jgi:hypothetical protein